LLGTQLQIFLTGKPLEFAIAEEEVGPNIVRLPSRAGCSGKSMSLGKSSHSKPTDAISYPGCD